MNTQSIDKVIEQHIDNYKLSKNTIRYDIIVKDYINHNIPTKQKDHYMRYYNENKQM